MTEHIFEIVYKIFISVHIFNSIVLYSYLICVNALFVASNSQRCVKTPSSDAVSVLFRIKTTQDVTRENNSSGGFQWSVMNPKSHSITKISTALPHKS